MNTPIENVDAIIAPQKKKRRTKRTPKKKPQQSGQPRMSERPKTTLGQKLWKLRQKMVASGIPLLNREELELEISERKGEREKGGL